MVIAGLSIAAGVEPLPVRPPTTTGANLRLNIQEHFLRAEHQGENLVDRLLRRLIER